MERETDKEKNEKDLPSLFRNALEEIGAARKILLITHENPDADGVSSMLALGLWLRRIDKEVYLYTIDEFPEYLRELPGSERITQILPDEKIDVVIGFDYGDWKRMRIDEFLERQEEALTITFDHHPSDKQKGDIVIVDTASSSTAELVYDFLLHSGVTLDANIATCLAAGILADTGGFIHSNTSAKTLHAIADLVATGVNLRSVWDMLTHKKDIKNMALVGEAVLRTEKNGDILISSAKKEHYEKYGAVKEDLSGFIDLLMKNEDTKGAVFLTEDLEDGGIKGSLRADKSSGFNMSKLAEKFGGGGHILASGFKTSDSWQNVFEKLHTLLKTIKIK